MYSSSRLVTLLILDGSFPSVHEFQRRKVAQGLMGHTQLQVCSHPRSWRFSVGSWSEAAITSQNSSLWVRCERSVWPFSFGDRGGQYEQSHLSLLTSFLELRSELRPTVHLYDWRYDIKN